MTIRAYEVGKHQWFAVERIVWNGSVRQIIGPFRTYAAARHSTIHNRKANPMAWRVETWKTLSMKRAPTLESDTVKTRLVNRIWR